MGPNSDFQAMSVTLRFHKLNGTNYHAWADNMKAVFQSLWLYVEGLEECPDKPDSLPPLIGMGNNSCLPRPNIRIGSS